ncbi:MAG: T9SS type A sorting domain-containing protein, partial [Calditrichaeota bacterium]|nr:T9SS type A sorting domain-containing protein [Calditrichota bacterium]
WKNSGKWTNLGNNIWRMDYNWNPRRLLIDGKEILRTNLVSNIDGAKSKWCYSDNALYLYSTGNPAEVFQSMQGNKLYLNVRIRKQKYLILENLDLEGGSGHTIAIYGCSYLTIKNCAIGRYACMGIRVNPYQGQSSHHIMIENNLIDSGFHFIYGPPEKRGVEDGVLLTAGAHDCLIQSNQVLDWGHCGIYLYASYEGDPGVYNNIVCNNFISGKNISYMHGIGTDGREGLCQNNEFYGNLIKDTTVRNQINGNNNRVHHNVIDGVKNSPAKGATAQGFDLQGYGDGHVCHDNYIENNTIMNCEEAGIRIRADQNDKINNYFRNNIIYNCGTNSREALNGYGIVIDNHASVKGNIFENNCIYNPTTTKVIFYRLKSLTVSQFNANNGEHNDQMNSNIQKNPLFVNEIDNWRLSGESPCIDNGLLLGYTTDFYGMPVPVGASADIGACEYQNILSVRTSKERTISNFALIQNYPNPFNSITQISFFLPEKELVSLEIFNALGEKVAELVDEKLSSGRHVFRFDASGLSSGVYFYRFCAGHFQQVKKMILLR